ncbi:MAG: EamA family transporter, partial [Acidobacteriales bacterium]|nr:EamA family transporter [Terriglobales bacterium]
RQVGGIQLRDLGGLLLVVLNPWIVLGILFLIGFFVCYLNALSWADLTYVLPATSIGYVLLALIARFALHEQISLVRWAGIVLISAGVGFVTQGPALTVHEEPQAAEAVGAASRAKP